MEYTYEIKQDEDAGNPRDEFDNLSTFYAVRNNRHITGGKNDVEYSYREDLDDKIADFRKEGAVIVEFSHNAGTQFAVIQRRELKKEYLDHGYTTRKALYWARRCAQGEIETWKSWAEGEVYGFVVENEDGEHVDSCWGFYGEKYAIEEAESIIEWHKENDKEEAKKLKTLEADWVL